MADRFYRVALLSTIAGQQCVNTFCIFGDDAFLDFTPMTAQGLADKIGGDTALTTAYKALLGADSTYDMVSVSEMLAPGSTAIPDSGAHTVNVVGTIATPTTIPDALCAVLHLSTNAAVRSGHGRMFLPPLRSVVNLTDELVSSGYTTLVNSFIAALDDYYKGGSAWTVGGSHWQLGVYSRTRRARGEPYFAFGVTGMVLKKPVTWLRSRRLSFA